jgi:SNF2 family DNA or RNA helicase
VDSKEESPFNNTNENNYTNEQMDTHNDYILNDSTNLTQKEFDDLFDLIYYHHKKENIKINDELNKKQLKDLNETLNSLEILRQYQIDAIKWMLFKENKIINKDNQIVYYQKYFGAFCEQMPEHLSSLPGGILADEMGLGKTIEILGTILINQRESIPKYEIKFENEDELNIKKNTTNKYYFGCSCGVTDKDLLAILEQHLCNLKILLI